MVEAVGYPYQVDELMQIDGDNDIRERVHSIYTTTKRLPSPFKARHVVELADLRQHALGLHASVGING